MCLYTTSRVLEVLQYTSSSNPQKKKTHQVQTRVKENSLLIKVALGGAPITNADHITLLFVLSYK